MRILLSILGMALLSGGAQAAVETLYVKAQPSIALAAAPAPDAVTVRRLTPGDTLTVIGRQPGFVNVELADGVQGWLRDADVTAAAPPAQRVVALEQEGAQLRQQLASAQEELRNTQARLRRAEQATAAVRESGAGEAAELEAERNRLQQRVAAQDAQMTELRDRIAELEMAQQMAQDAARLLATREAQNDDAGAGRFSPRELIGAAVTALVLLMAGIGFGMTSARRRLRQRYHGIDL